MEKRTMLALFVTMILLVVFQYVYAPRQAVQPAPEQTAAVSEVAEENTRDNTIPKKETKKADALVSKKFETAESEPVLYEDDYYRITLDGKGGRVLAWEEKEYGTVLLSEGSFALSIRNGDDSALPYVYERTDSGFRFVFDDDGYKIIKSFSFDPRNGYLCTFSVEGNVAVDGVTVSKSNPEEASLRAYEKPLYYENKLRYVKLKEGETKQVSFTKWAGFTTKYHLGVFLSDDGVMAYTETGGKGISASLDMRNIDSVTFFYGPKRMSLLNTVEPHLDESIQFGGIIKPISLVFLAGLNYFYGLIGNFGIAIIILTLIVKLLFFPLTHKSYISMAKMQKIQPEVQKIQKKFKEKPEEMNKKVMELYSKNKVNPMGGCLPLLLQFPVLWALFRVFNNAIELKGQKFFLWINDLSAPDTLFKMPFSMPFLGHNFNVLPVLMFVSMIWMQKSNPSQGNVQGANKFMMQVFMPLFMLVIFYSMPSGLVLYFLLSNVISILQQQYTRNHLKNQEA